MIQSTTYEKKHSSTLRQIYFLTAILLFATTLVAQQYQTALRQTNSQLTVIPIPRPLPSFGGLIGAGISVTIPPYTSTQIRCTDFRTNPANTKMYSYEVTDTGGDNVYAWNSDQTRLRVVQMATGSTIVLSFDGSTCRMIPNSVAPAGAQWDLHNPNVDYYQQGMTKVMTRTFNGVLPPITRTLFDFANCPLLSTVGPITWNTEINTNDGNLFLMSFGVQSGAIKQGQDTSQYVTAYRVDNNVCSLWNTLTGIVQVSGTIPQTVTVGQVSTFYPFTIHSAYLAPGGQYIVGVGSTCTGCPTPHGGFIWYPALTHVDMPTVLVGGHSTSGFLTAVNITSAPKAAQRQFTNLAVVTYISSNEGVSFPFPQDVHMGWANNTDGTDTAPLCMSQMSINQPQPVQILTPLEDEIYCFDMVNPGTFIRLGKTLSSGLGPNFRTQQAIMATGSKGLIAYSSDAFGTIGRVDGQPGPCTLGNGRPDGCRSDVFILKQ